MTVEQRCDAGVGLGVAQKKQDQKQRNARIENTYIERRMGCDTIRYLDVGACVGERTS